MNISSSSCNLKGSITVEYIEKAKVAPKTFTNCDTNFDGNIPIKLDDLNATIITNYKPEFVVKYYQNLTDATLGNANTLPNNWSYNTDTTIYVRVENGVCAPEIQPIEFKLGTTLNLLTNEATPPSICDDDFDGIINIKFSDISPLIVQDYQDFTIEYYLDPNFTGTPLPNDWSYNQDTDVYVRVFSQSVCVTAKGIIHFKIGPKITANDIVKQVCDGDFNNSENIDLRDYLPFVTSETGYQPTFYASKTDAIKEQNPIGNTHSISSNSIYFVKLKKAGICDNISSITLNFGQPTKSKMPPVVTICEGETTNLDAGLEFSAYLWSNGETSHEIKNVGKGDYTVILTSANGCTYTQKVSVVESPKAIVDVTKFNTTICDDNLDGVIEVNLNRVNSAILLNPGIYKVKYYLNSSDANAGNANTINTDADRSFSTDTTIFVRIESDFCPPQIYPLGFKFGNKLPLIAKDVTHTICDDDLDGSKTLNLDDYKGNFSMSKDLNTQENRRILSDFYKKYDSSIRRILHMVVF